MTRTQLKLLQVERAIERLLSGYESSTVDGVTYKRTDLSKLQAREEYLEQKLARESGRVRRVSAARFPSEG
ncbi:hypothetical protein [Victivallis vadensis]|uniref:hypothetical protein n=1 Tax=Victivallis vadensis TaxID=172901 RepID=UPI002592518C|nr:hypothetical protein [uncultured Victivallis sp.]